jgi:predicted O-methyltransferase YrrM
MKTLVKSAVRKAGKAMLQDALFSRPRGDSFDILDVAFFAAAMESARFYEEFMLTAACFETDLMLLRHALEIAPPAGLILEFGVASGRTIRHMGGLAARPIHGFDSFEGLPETWRTGFDKGAFAQPLPAVPANVQLHKGWFSETLPAFLETTDEMVGLLHVDCDLYSSTAFVLRSLADRIRPGTVLVFDEYFNYPGWKQHEHKAFQEFIAQTGLVYRFDSFVPGHQQVCVVIAGDPANE